MLKLILTVLSLAILVQNVESKRILAAILSASYSHQVFYQQFWRELAIRGHDVVVITSDPTNEELPNFKEISIAETYGPIKQYLDVIINSTMLELILKDTWTDIGLSVSEFQLKLPQVQDLLNNKTEHFDLVIVEHFISPAFGFQYLYKCPMIGVISIDGMPISHEIMGNPTHKILYPSALMETQENLTFFQRVGFLLFGSLARYMQQASLGRFTELGRRYFGKDMPPIEELLENTDMLFVNANPVFSAVRPLTPSTISLAGGIHMQPAKQLPKNIQHFLDNANQGVIYFSLGSNVKSNKLTIDLKKIIMETLSQLPYKVLWKFEDDKLPGKPDNVMITKWAPQQDVLRHKNVKLFITQGGLQSLEESLYSHIPMVVMPFFGDQQANAQKTKTKGLGVVVDRNNLNVEDFKTAILSVIDNPTYKEIAKRLASEIQDTPQTPLEKAVWWTEYVLKHNGAQHLKGPRIPSYQFYYFDVLAFLGAVILIIFGLLYTIVKYSVKGVCGLMKCTKGKAVRKNKLKTK